MNAVRTTLTGMLLFSLSAWSVPAAAQGKKKNVTANLNAPYIANLHATTALLKKADHDYKGHRVKAIHEIHAAVKALAPGKHHPHPKIPSSGGTLPQNVSDGLLQQALTQLQTIQGQIANSAGPGNRPLAVTHIQNAIGQLKTALNIR